MDSVFKICKKGACGITITGLERDNDEYLNETDDIPLRTCVDVLFVKDNKKKKTRTKNKCTKLHTKLEF